MNYWMFRVSNKWGNKTNKCLEENNICSGWNLDYRQDRDIILKKYPEAKRMAIKFMDIQIGDIVLMPLYGSVAIGEVISSAKYSEEEAWKDSLDIKWMVKNFPRSNFSSNLQSSLKYRGTFLNLHKYRNELDALVKDGVKTLDEVYYEKFESHKSKQIEALATHIKDRSNLFFQDTEFEFFIKDLIEFEFPGFVGIKNPVKNEAKDGRDLVFEMNLSSINLTTSLNVQIKQHDQITSAGLEQIKKTQNLTQEGIVKNIIISNANFNESISNDAENLEIILIGSLELAEIIYNNIEKISEKHLIKLGVIKSISFN